MPTTTIRATFLRHRVLPLLSEKFPAYRDTLGRSAQHFAEASSLLDELAQQDAAQTIHANTLAVAALQALSPPRAKNLLRYFSAWPQRSDAASHATGRHAAASVQRAEDAVVCIAYGDWQVRRYRGKVYALHALGEFDRSLVLPWLGEAELDWPAMNARLCFERMHHLHGEALCSPPISLAKLQRAPVTLRLRHSGESLRPHPDAPTRSLKNLLQEHHIPPWQRETLASHVLRLTSWYVFRMLLLPQIIFR